LRGRTLLEELPPLRALPVLLENIAHLFPFLSPLAIVMLHHIQILVQLLVRHARLVSLVIFQDCRHVNRVHRGLFHNQAALFAKLSSMIPSPSL
jgi:hypothetical protein